MRLKPDLTASPTIPYTMSRFGFKNLYLLAILVLRLQNRRLSRKPLVLNDDGEAK